MLKEHYVYLVLTCTREGGEASVQLVHDVHVHAYMIAMCQRSGDTKEQRVSI